MKRMKELCSIIILSYNQVEYTKMCLESIRKYTKYPYEIIIIDNGSEKETLEYLELQKDINLIKNERNIGFAAGCNQGVELSAGEYILLLNNDIIVTDRWLENMICLLKSDTKIDMVGPLTNNTVGKQRIETSYGNNLEEMQIFAKNIANKQVKPWRTLRLVAFCVLMRAEFFFDLGGFDTNFQVGNYEDDDFNIKGLLKNKVYYICRNAFVHHFMNISFKKNNLPREEIMMKNKLLLEKKWANLHWNHYAAYNEKMLEHILQCEGKNILLLGCGLASLAIELKDREENYYIVGIEHHPIRYQIAKQFVDKAYLCEDLESLKKRIEYGEYDIVVIEGMLEREGNVILEYVKACVVENALIILRIFNINHITTIEKLVMGKVGGNLLCAVSEEFQYYYSDMIEELLFKEGYYICDKEEVRKSFSIVQDELKSKLYNYNEFIKKSEIYNTIYFLKQKES